MRNPDFFLHHYAPVTTAFNIVDIKYDRILDYWIDKKKETDRSIGWDVPIQHVDCGLAEKLHLLLPLDGQKRLLTETHDGQIVVFSNMPNGDGSSDARHLADKFKSSIIGVTFTKDGKNGNLDTIGSTQFGWVDCATERDDWGLHKHRSLAAHRESRWEWHENGDPFPWEKTENYKKRIIKERLTPDMVESYCENFGIKLFDPDYYSGRATLITQRPVKMKHNYNPNRKYMQRYPNLTE